MVTAVVVQWDKYVQCGRHICSGTFANNVKCMYVYQCFWSHCWLQEVNIHANTILFYILACLSTYITYQHAWTLMHYWYKQTLMPGYLHSYISAHIQTGKHSYMPVYIYTYIYMENECIHFCTSVYTQTYIHTHIHACLPTYKHSYMHTT